MDQNEIKKVVEEAPKVKPEAKKLTNWAEEPTVDDLKQDFTDAASDRDTHKKNVNLWLDNLNMTGTAKKAKRAGRSNIQPKLIRKQAEWRYAALSEPFLNTDDLFDVDPVTFEDKPGAIQNGLVLNNQFNTKINKNKFIDDYVRTGVDEGTIIVKVSWNYKEKVTHQQVPNWVNKPVKDELLAAELRRQGKPAEETVQDGEREEEVIDIITNHPELEICDYRNITIDPSCEGDVDKAKFIIYSFETSMAELEADSRYSNLDAIEIENSSPLNDGDHETTDESEFNFNDKPRKLFVAYEYWGFRDIAGDGTLTPIVATYVDGVMIRMERNPYPDQKLPFVIVQYLPVRRSIYGEPDGALLEDNQKVVGAVTRGMIDIMGRSANGQAGYRKDALDLTNKRKFDKGLDYEFNANVHPDQAFYMHKYPEIPRSAEYMLNMTNGEAEAMTGVKAFSGTSGLSGDSLGSSVGGIRSAMDAASKRELGILRRLSTGMTQIGRKIISMNAVFLEEEEVIRITNDVFVPIRRDDLVGNFDLRLSISTAEADNEKASELAFMLQTMGNNMDVGMSKLILGDIARLRKMPVLAKSIGDYEPQPDPIAQEKATLEVELLKAQIRNENAKANENTVDIDLKRAKTSTEIAKANNLNSDADIKDLNYLEQESGVAHNREIDKESTKIKGALDSKAADAMFAGDGPSSGFNPVPATIQ